MFDTNYKTESEYVLTDEDVKLQLVMRYVDEYKLFPVEAEIKDVLVAAYNWITE